MAIVTTQIHSGSTVGDGVDSVQAQKLTLQSASKVVSITALITGKPSSAGAICRLMMVTSPIDIAASAAPDQLKRHAFIKEFKWLCGNENIIHIQTPPRLVQGLYLYTWLEIPTVETAGTLTSYATEL